MLTTTSDKYAACFGFTEEEVLSALNEFNLSDQGGKVKDWYDGFTFGARGDIYNPWSIINFLDKRKVGAYWENTSSNSLVERLLRRGSAAVKKTFEVLLDGEVLNMEIDEQIVYDQQPKKKNAVWSLLLAGRYVVASNRESGFGRYDVMPDPRNVSEDDAVIIEFKVQDEDEKELF